MPTQLAIRVAVALLFAGVGATGVAAQSGCGGGKPACCGCQVKWVCCPTYEKEKIEKSGFEVECEHICVPKVKFPWQKCCTPRCARVICVHRLMKETVECGEKCVIKWEAKAVCTRCCKPGGYGCPNSQCGPAACAAPLPAGERLAPPVE